MTLAISKAVEEGAKAVVCASTGNTSASAAAYASRAGLTCAVLIPEGYIALGKLAQALIHGARVLQVRGNFDDALEIVRELGERAPITVVNSVNPFRIDGQKTAAFEIVDALGDAPDVHCIPVGNAGNITAYWKGYREYQDAGPLDRAAPRCSGSRPRARRRSCSATRSSSPRRSPPPSASASRRRGTARPRPRASRAAGSTRSPTRRSSPPTASSPPSESVFCEPASAASVAGLLKVGVPAGRHRRLHAHRPRPQGPRPRHRRDRGALRGRRRLRRHPRRAGPLTPEPRTRGAGSTAGSMRAISPPSEQT